ncbi:MAG: hypothetical protein Q8K68_05555, partial [Nitrospirota bacterium]|nr:hypothetical protein [Nitrospirota bacterium]
WYLLDTSKEVRSISVTPPPDLTPGLSIYTNGTYGFSVFYPDDALISYEFNPSYHLGSLWRANALPTGEGVPVVAIVPYQVTNDTAYPRYFNAMVRIGASADPDEIARCEEVAEEQGETRLPDVSIQGHTWSAFSFQSAGMMQYAEGVSYRTLFEGSCIAMEKVRTGSSYREDASGPNDISDETLAAEYAALDAIVSSFSFAR